MEIPQSDFDFESANAKFNKGDLIKEAIASGSPISEIADGNAVGNGVDSLLNGTNDPARKDSYSTPIPAYNKSSSFFDNISSEAKDREDSADARFDPRVQRGAEFKKNVETFGQGNVDSGYRGRGRGGYRGQRRGGGYRGRGRGTSNPAADNAAFVQN
jgi:protein LSM14